MEVLLQPTCKPGFKTQPEVELNCRLIRKPERGLINHSRLQSEEEYSSLTEMFYILQPTPPPQTHFLFSLYVEMWAPPLAPNQSFLGRS